MSLIDLFEFGVALVLSGIALIRMSTRRRPPGE